MQAVYCTVWICHVCGNSEEAFTLTYEFKCPWLLFSKAPFIRRCHKVYVRNFWCTSCVNLSHKRAEKFSAPHRAMLKITPISTCHVTQSWFIPHSFQANKMWYKLGSTLNLKPNQKYLMEFFTIFSTYSPIQGYSRELAETKFFFHCYGNI